MPAIAGHNAGRTARPPVDPVAAGGQLGYNIAVTRRHRGEPATTNVGPGRALAIGTTIAIALALTASCGTLSSLTEPSATSAPTTTIASSRPAYAAPAPVYVDEYPACRMVRERFWDGYGWRVRRYEVCN